MDPVIVKIAGLSDDQIWTKAKNFASQLKQEKAQFISEIKETYNDVEHSAEVSGKAFGMSAKFGIAVKDGVIAVVATETPFGFSLIESKVKEKIESTLLKLFNN